MKALSLVFLILTLAVVTGYAQNKTFGVGTSTLNPNAALQVDAPSGNQGLQLPRLSTAQRTAMTLTTTDKGLMVFDTNLNSIHTWNGSAWTNGQKLQFPYKDSLAVDPAVGDGFFHLVNASNQANADVIKGVMKGTGGAAGSFILRNAASIKPAIYGETIGTASAGLFKVNNAAAGGTALVGTTNSNVGGVLAPVGVYGESTGTGSVGGAFWNTNVANTYPALYSQTNGTGPALVANQNGATGDLAQFRSNNTTKVTIGKDGYIYNFSDNSWAAFQSANSGDGFAGAFWIDKATSANSALYAETHGTGVSIEAGTSTGWTAIKGTNSGTGNGGHFSINNPSSTDAALYATTNGTGSSFSAETSTGFASLFAFGHNNSKPISALTDGQSNAGYFENNNASNNSPTIYSVTNGSGMAIMGNNNGTGTGGNFTVNNAASSAPALFASTIGTGAAISGSTSSGYAAVTGQHSGATNGFGGLFEVMNAANTYQAVKGTTFGAGNAAFFEINNAANNTPAVQSMTNGTGAAGDFQIANAASSSSVLFAKTTGTGVTVHGYHVGAGGTAGSFEINNASNTSPAINATTVGAGPVLFANQLNAGANNIAVFQSNNSNVARIDDTGKGWFNGGTTNSGADVAELFDVEGNKQEYEPGDVLVISEQTDRTVEKSSIANSTKVAGVYATKPGVMLTEQGIDENLDQLVPMGVIGVIPTKVCLENGPIKRGDLLVTSSMNGHAMKAISANGDGIYPAGVIIGKALENFDRNNNGIIKVLVNIK